MISLDSVFVINSVGQLVFAGLEQLPEPPNPKVKKRKKRKSK